MRSSALMSIVLLLPLSAGAQANADGHGLFLTGGVAAASVERINDVLGTSTASFARQTSSFGLGVYVVRRGLLLSPSFVRSPSSDLKAANGRTTSMHREVFSVDVGKLLYREDGASVVVEGGAGWGRTAIAVTKGTTVDTTGAPGSFLDAATNSTSPVHFQRNAIVENIGLRLQELLIRRPHGDGERGLAIGIHVGYRFSQDIGSWSANGQTVSDGPEGALRGPFIFLNIGPAEWSR